MTTLASPLPAAPTQRILSGVPKNAEALALAELLTGRQGKAWGQIVHIAVNDRELESMEAALAFFAPDARILRFPAWDCMPYDRTSPRPQVMAERMQTLAALANGSAAPCVVLTTVNAAL